MIKIYNSNNKKFMSLYGTGYKLNSFTNADILYKEIELVTPDNMSDFSNDIWEITTTGTYSDRYMWKAFDNNKQTWADSRGSTNPRFFGWNRKDGKKSKITYYEIYSIAVGASQDNMGEWKLQGSDNNSTWEDIHHVGESTVITNWVNCKDNDVEPLRFEVGSNKYFSNYRIVMIKNAQGSTNTEYLPYICEFKAYGKFK